MQIRHVFTSTYDSHAGNNWTGAVAQLSKSRQVIAVEMQGHGRTADIKGGEIFGDMRPRSESRLAILPDTTHITLMDKLDVIVPMVNDFLNAPPQKK